MKPRNYIMANVAKHDPARYHIRTVEDEHNKLQRNRARRKSKERKEIQVIDMVESRSIAL
jgi:hypothetical protein